MYRNGIVAITVIIAALVVFNAVAARAGEGAGSSAPADKALPAPTPDTIEEVTLTIRAEGFDPTELARPAGRFLLSVDNRSAVEELTFRLNGEDGECLREMRIQRGTVDWSEMVDLPAGRYTLTEVNHAGWACRIILR